MPSSRSITRISRGEKVDLIFATRFYLGNIAPIPQLLTYPIMNLPTPIDQLEMITHPYMFIVSGADAFFFQLGFKLGS